MQAQNTCGNRIAANLFSINDINLSWTHGNEQRR
jgi:hypothetical protein